MEVGGLMLRLSLRFKFGVVVAATPSVAWPTLGASVSTLGGGDRGCVSNDGMETGDSAWGIAASGD
jgi:hypothetical protein